MTLIWSLIESHVGLLVLQSPLASGMDTAVSTSSRSIPTMVGIQQDKADKVSESREGRNMKRASSFPSIRRKVKVMHKEELIYLAVGAW